LEFLTIFCDSVLLFVKVGFGHIQNQPSQITTSQACL